MKRRDLKPGMEVALGVADRNYFRHGYVRQVIILSANWWIPKEERFWVAGDHHITNKLRVCGAEYDAWQDEWNPVVVNHTMIRGLWADHQKKLDESKAEQEKLAVARGAAVDELRAQMPEGVDLWYTEVDEEGRVNETRDPEWVIVRITVADMRRVLKERA